MCLSTFMPEFRISFLLAWSTYWVENFSNFLEESTSEIHWFFSIISLFFHSNNLYCNLHFLLYVNLGLACSSFSGVVSWKSRPLTLLHSYVFTDISCPLASVSLCRTGFGETPTAFSPQHFFFSLGHCSLVVSYLWCVNLSVTYVGKSRLLSGVDFWLQLHFQRTSVVLFSPWKLPVPVLWPSLLLQRSYMYSIIRWHVPEMSVSSK